MEQRTTEVVTDHANYTDTYITDDGITVTTRMLG